MKKLALGFLFLSLGIGLLVASIAVLVEASVVQISLHRNGAEINGSVLYRYCGLPVFWFGVEGLDRVEKRELQVADGISEGGKAKRIKSVSRAVFLDNQGNVIAWGERTGLVNAIEPLQKFLESDSPNFDFVEKSVGHPWDVFRERVVSGLFALTLVVGGLLSLAGGLGQWHALIKSKRRSEPSAA